MGYIERCLNSVSFADEIIVVDSYSNDGTHEYLLEHPQVKVIQHPFENFTAQKSFTLGQATHDWILFLDADEVVPEKLKREIVSKVNTTTETAAFWFYREFMFQNERLQFSGWQTDKNYRLFRKSKARFSDKKIVHETLEVDGISGVMDEKLLHYCYKNYDDYKAKMLRYGRLKAKESFFKERKFSYLSMLLKPSWKFFHHYVLRLGIFDGKKGVIISYLNALSDFEKYKELRKMEKRNELVHYLEMP